MRRLILNADDFGLHPAVNEAVLRAHTKGALTAASLMTGAPGCEEAVALARATPSLAVGLHITLTDGVPVLPAARIPALTQKNGRFRDDMAAMGLLLALSKEARAELYAEVLAQVQRFTETGLPCDHINTHKHFHLHPVIAASVMQAAAGAGIRCIRLPVEEPASVGGRGHWSHIIQNRWCRTLRERATGWGLAAAARVVGLKWSGAFTAERLLFALPRLPAGVTELYFHPATQDDVPGGAPGYQYRAELTALTDPRVLEALSATPRGGYAAMLAP
jgi:hopanoid biosynthesis associated protein HpnK